MIHPTFTHRNTAAPAQISEEIPRRNTGKLVHIPDPNNLRILIQIQQNGSVRNTQHRGFINNGQLEPPPIEPTSHCIFHSSTGIQSQTGLHIVIIPHIVFIGTLSRQIIQRVCLWIPIFAVGFTLNPTTVPNDAAGNRSCIRVVLIIPDAAILNRISHLMHSPPRRAGH